MYIIHIKAPSHYLSNVFWQETIFNYNIKL